MTRYFLGEPIHKNLIGVIFTITLLLALSLSGCGATSGDIPALGTRPGPLSTENPGGGESAERFTFGGTLYVTNAGDGSLIAFDPLSTNRGLAKAALAPIVQDENISPSRRFPETVTGPTGIFLDRINDTLYVANTGQNAISIYGNASTLTVPFSVTAVISGDKTNIDQPFGVAVDASDPAKIRIFVANKGSNSILVFEKGCAGAASLSGNIKPCRILLGTEDPNSGEPAKFPLDLPRALAIDTTRNILYISNMGNDSILVYRNAGTLGGLPSDCKTNFAPCNQVPDQVISPHTDNDPSKQISKLELPFGLFIDNANDRLYVTNTGLNTPGIFIYEEASQKGGAVQPERVIAGLNLPDASPSIKNLTQLTIPTGIDVDVATGQLYVINNNSPNNVNQTSGNVDSPSLIIFDDIDTNCPLPVFPETSTECNISPNRRIGGDGNTSIDQNGKFIFDASLSTLSSPTGVAFDPAKEIIYITNTGANNIFKFAFAGDIAPLKINADLQIPGNTDLEEPSDFHYDTDLDRLFVANFGSGPNVAAKFPILVYEKISALNFNASQATWVIKGDANFRLIRGFHIDKARGYLLTLNAGSPLNFPTFSIYCIPNTSGGVNPDCPVLPTAAKRQWFSDPGNDPIEFPTNNSAGTTGLQLRPPSALRIVDLDNNSATVNEPTAMEVDETSGEVYIADQLTHSIFVYDLDTLSFTRTISGANTGLNKPHGLSYDATRNILYVTNIGNDKLLAFHCAGKSGKGKNNLDESCTNATTGLITVTSGDVPPDRTLTTTNVAAEDQLLTPIAPQIDPSTNTLFLISSGNKAIFAYDDADQLDNKNDPINIKIRPGRKIAGDTNTLFNFTPPPGQSRNTGALLVADQNGGQVIFVGQPVSPFCARNGAGDLVTPGTCPAGALLIFGQAGGKVSPSDIWKGGDGSFTTPSALAVDTSRNVLYVTNQSTDTLSILKNADQIDVHVNPGTGKTDLLNIQLNSPSGLFIDTGANRLYVSNRGNNTILAFDNANALVDGAAPNADLTMTGFPLNAPRGITVDTDRNRLYVANTGGNSVLTFLVNGTATLDFALSGPNTRLISPISVALDTLRDDLYVLNSGTDILVFEDISTRNGDVAPSRTISGSDSAGNNFMNAPSAIFIDPKKDLLYVSDLGADALYFFNNASTAQGQAEHTSLSGDNTGLNKPSALFVDTTTGSP